MNWDVIYSYSRKQAIIDGVLIDVSDTGKQLGFKYQTAITSAVWNGVIDKNFSCQSTSGRLWDTLNVLRHAAVMSKSESPILLFKVLFYTENGDTEEVELKCIIGPGDTLSPVLTICYPHED